MFHKKVSYQCEPRSTHPSEAPLVAVSFSHSFYVRAFAQSTGMRPSSFLAFKIVIMEAYFSEMISHISYFKLVINAELKNTQLRKCLTHDHYQKLLSSSRQLMRSDDNRQQTFF